VRRYTPAFDWYTVLRTRHCVLQSFSYITSSAPHNCTVTKATLAEIQSAFSSQLLMHSLLFYMFILFTYIIYLTVFRTFQFDADELVGWGRQVWEAMRSLHDQKQLDEQTSIIIMNNEAG
jgi:hypothetical protein